LAEVFATRQQAYNHYCITEDNKETGAGDVILSSVNAASALLDSLSQNKVIHCPNK
jgi:hypothetical protein